MSIVRILAVCALMLLSASQARSQERRSFANYVAVNLDKLNSGSNEFSPFISVDEQTILFVSDRKGFIGMEDFWMSTRNGPGDGDWSDPINLRSLNSPVADGAISSTIDGQTFYLATSRGTTVTNDVDIWTAYFGLDGRLKLRSLPRPVNTYDWESQPCISPDGRSLYFASNRPGKIGSHLKDNVDIFVSHMLMDSSWTDPVNLGSRINTGGYDASPFIAPDGKTLYFCSDRPGGKGGLDLYQVYKIGPNDTDWSDPLDLPEPINSSKNDFFLSIAATGFSAYFTSDRDGGKGKFDLWVASPPNDNPHRSYRLEGIQIGIDPNPARDLTRVGYEFAKEKKYVFTVEDLEGKKVLEVGEPTGLKGTLTLNLTSLAPNIYLFVTTSPDGERDVQRLVVVK
jgi:hypothetical protein